MPYIISYIVYGYVFLTAYYWITFKNNKDFTNLLVKSIATSYIITTLFQLVTTRFKITFVDELYHILALLICSVVMGFLIGKLTTHRWFNFLLHKLHVGRTTNTNIWDDVIKPYTWVRVFMKDGSSYLGQYRYGEPFKSEPIIVLSTYQKLDKDTDIVIDNSQNRNELIMINTKDFDRIEITYTDVPKSKFKDHVQSFFHLGRKINSEDEETQK